MVDISTKAIERMAIEKPKCGYIQAMLALAKERDVLLSFVQDFAEHRFRIEAERTGPEPDDCGDRFTGYEMVSAFQEDALIALGQVT